MPTGRTLILGAGFGGLTVATELRDMLDGRHEIVMVDRQEQFMMGLRKLWVLAGIGTLAEGSRPRERVSGGGIRFVQSEVSAIDPGARSATCDGEAIEADHMVVALGAEPRPDLIPGLTEHGHDVWDPAGVPRLQEALERFDGGRLAVLIAGAPYPCPPAPYELAMLLDERLRERGLRDRTDLSVVTLQPMLLPNAGPGGSAWVGDQLTSRGVTFEVGRKLERVEPGRAVFSDGELRFDLLVGVPPHRVPAIVEASGLTGETGWVMVDRDTLETSHPGVFAIGDVTQIKLANDLPLPKAGMIAEAEGRRVARAVAATLRDEAPAPPFDGRGFCFIETGGSQAALVRGEFFAAPEPQVSVVGPSRENAAEKRRFEAERLERWFGG